jgi:hypothetical protein
MTRSLLLIRRLCRHRKGLRSEKAFIITANCDSASFVVQVYDHMIASPLWK